MNDNKVVTLVSEPQRMFGTTAAQLRELADRVENDELTSVVAFAFEKDGAYAVYGESCRSRHQLIGMLMEAAVERVIQTGNTS